VRRKREEGRGEEEKREEGTRAVNIQERSGWKQILGSCDCRDFLVRMMRSGKHQQ